MKFKKFIDNGLFEMSTLGRNETGIDKYNIWVSTKGNSKHGPRIKISSINRSNNLDVVISISDNPEIKTGKNIIKNIYIKEIKKWIILNKKVLLDYWFEKIITKPMLDQIKKINS